MTTAFRYQAVAQVWTSPGPGGWHFLTLPRDVSDGLRAVRGAGSRAWGSLRVVAAIGGTRWRTSVFPDSKAGAFLLPIKAAVRVREGVRAGDTVEVAIEVAL